MYTTSLKTWARAVTVNGILIARQHLQITLNL